MMMIKNRSELLFLYDIRDTNPNGDPFDENKPRIDEETGINIVTDVRLKRTIRDYWKDFLNKEIFIREIAYKDDNIQDAKKRAEDFLLVDGEKIEKKELASIAKDLGRSDSETDLMVTMKEIIDENIKSCIDIRLFGVTLPISYSKSKSSSITYTGPVQFKMGRSLHKVNLEYIKGTGAFAATEGATRKTFREEYFLSYSLISFYGIINENAARKQNLPVTEDDVEFLLDGIWNGTKNLISRSKVGQNPRLLIRVEYAHENYHIGELDHLIQLITDKNEEDIRSIRDYQIDITKMKERFLLERDKIQRIQICVDPNLVFHCDDKVQPITECLQNLPVETIDL